MLFAHTPWRSGVCIGRRTEAVVHAHSDVANWPPPHAQASSRTRSLRCYCVSTHGSIKLCVRPPCATLTPLSHRLLGG